MFTELSTQGGAAVLSRKAGKGPDLKALSRRARAALVRSVARGLPVSRPRKRAAGGSGPLVSIHITSNILELSRWLPPADFALVRWASERPVRGLAPIVGEPEWMLRRRTRRLLARILSPAYRHVAARLEQLPFPPTWPPPASGSRKASRGLSESAFHLTIARAVFIAGVSMRATAEACGLPLHVVRRHCDLVLLEMKTE